MWLQYSISTLTSPNLTKIWRGHVLSFVDLKWNDPEVNDIAQEHNNFIHEHNNKHRKIANF